MSLCRRSSAVSVSARRVTLSVLLRFYMEDPVPMFSYPRDSPGSAGDVVPHVVEVQPRDDHQPDVVVLPHGPTPPGDAVSEAMLESLADLSEYFGEIGTWSVSVAPS